jgi:hypothetical protein
VEMVANIGPTRNYSWGGIVLDGGKIVFPVISKGANEESSLSALHLENEMRGKWQITSMFQNIAGWGLDWAGGWASMEGGILSPLCRSIYPFQSRGIGVGNEMTPSKAEQGGRSRNVI